MFDKLQAYYPHSLIFSEQPNFSFYSNYHWFNDVASSRWIGIPVEAIETHELSLLKALFHYEILPFSMNSKIQKWYDFLFSNGELPSDKSDTTYRLILFQLQGEDWERINLEEAIYGFFHEESIILWEGQTNGVIVEHYPNPKNIDKLFLPLSHMLESDFFIKAHFYCGEVSVLSKDWPEHLKRDKSFFKNAIRLIPALSYYTFEKCFPFMLVNKLPQEMHEWLQDQILSKISDEPELLTAVMCFLENNSNATLTAKQLYIHRNTLQYRLDKFTQKTGVSLKDFHSSITVYLACLLSEIR